MQKDQATELVRTATLLYSAAQAALEEERRYLKRAVASGVKAGLTHRELADLTGLSRQRITQIVHE